MCFYPISFLSYSAWQNCCAFLVCPHNEIQWNSFMKWSLANLRLRELSWDALDLSILENNAQLGAWIQVLFSRRRMKKFRGLTSSKCQSAFGPKIHSQRLGFYYIFGLFIYLTFWKMLLLLFVLFACFILVWGCCYFYCLLDCLHLVGFYVGLRVFLWVFFGDWVFYLPYKIICIVQAGLKYSLFLCAPFLIQR